MGRKLTDDVSIEELLRMREEEGLSNYEIAQRVGVARNTIYRLIGKQPPHVRGSYGRQSAEKSRNAAPVQTRQAEEEIVPASLVLEMRMYQLAGLFATYRVCDRDRTLQITTKTGDQMELDLECIDDFIKELQAIRRKMSTPAPMEAW